MNPFKRNRVLAMDIGASDLKLAEFQFRKNGIELVKFAVRSFGREPGSEADIAPEIVLAIKNILQDQQIRPAPVVLSITGQSAFLRLVKLPPVTRTRIYQTIQYEALQNVPFPIDEVVWDYQLMSGGEQEYLNVMLVAVKTDIVQNITDCIEAAELDLEIVDVAPMALYNAVRYNYGVQKGCTLVIDIGARATNLVFIEEGRFFSRNLPVIGTGNAITQQLMKEFNLPFKDAEELKLAHASVAFGGAYEDYDDMVISRVSKTVRNAITRLHVEVERSINFYRTQQNGVKPARVLLAGGTSAIARMDQFFKEKLKIDNVAYLNSFKNIFVSRSVSDDEVASSAHFMGAVVGVALRYAFPCPLEVNLLPPKIMAEKAFRRKQPYLIVAAASLILIVLCWWAYFSQMTQSIIKREAGDIRTVQQLSLVESRLTTTEEEKAKLLGESHILASLEPIRMQWLTVLDGIHSCMLDGMWLVSVIPLSKNVERAEGEKPDKYDLIGATTVYTHVRIKGMIFADKATEKSIALFRDRLRDSQYFTDQTEIQWVSLLHQDDYARGFAIEVVLKSPLISRAKPGHAGAKM